MKVQPTMNDNFAAYYSDISTTAPGQIKFETSYTTDSRVDEIDDPAAKAINVLSPVRKRHSSCGDKDSSEFETWTANKIYTKELVFINQSRAINSEPYGANTFDQDLRESIMETKINRLKQEGMGKAEEPQTKSAGVRFSKVTVKEYSIQPGVNPGGSKGCPITMGWNPISTDIVDVNVFEKIRDEHRRPQPELKLVSAHREQMLKELGYSRKAILEGTKAANQERRRRFNTIARLKSSESQEMMEGLQRNVQNLVTFGSKKRREQKFLAPYTEEKPKLKLKMDQFARVFAE